jgi:hypothetical protein
MIKEAKNIDFTTTGRQPSKEDFALISDWIKKDKQRKMLQKKKIIANRKNKSNKRLEQV